MSRLLVVVVVAAVAGVAVADVPPPPPPKGKKYVNVSSEVKLAKGVSGYVFVTSVTNFRPAPDKPTFAKAELGAEKATAMPAAGRRTAVALVAVPQAAAAEFKTDADLFAALAANKVKGTQRVEFAGTATVSDAIKGDAVKWTYTVTGIDDKGIKTTAEGDGYEPPKAKKEPKNGKEPKNQDEGDEGDEPDAPLTARGGPMVAGVAASAALMLGGLWVVGRGRRRV